MDLADPYPLSGLRILPQIFRQHFEDMVVDVADLDLRIYFRTWLLDFVDLGAHLLAVLPVVMFYDDLSHSNSLVAVAVVKDTSC